MSKIPFSHRPGLFAIKGFLPLVISIFLLTALLVAFNSRVGPYPPLAKVLNPFRGVWQNIDRSTVRYERQLSELKAPVEIVWDSHGLPHIFAQNDADVYMAQGFVLASHRLFQMDLQTRFGSGRLSEWVGAKAWPTDAFFVRMGLRQAAEGTLEEIKKEDSTWSAVQAYTRGVNAYIESLSHADLPVEYKLLNVWPEVWTELRTAQLLMAMSFQLAGYSEDLNLTAVARRHGWDNMWRLFPDRPDNNEPIVPTAQRQKPWPRVDLLPPKQPIESFISVFDKHPVRLKPKDGNGSNSWAVSGQKSATGSPIVANDTHLGYSLPAIWYEMQLVTPNMNVYGATFPAAPGIIVGFNEQISWAVTNATSDVFDWYEVRFKDEKKEEYWYEGTWTPILKKTVETVLVRGEGPRKVELIYTHHGVVVDTQKDRGLVARWIASQPFNGLKTFFMLNRATSHESCQKALVSYQSPAQNFICADKEHLSITHNGQFPLRYRRQGRMVMDGSLADNDWHSWIPQEALPRLVDPPQGYLFSANQNPTDEKYPLDLGQYYAESYRAQQIRRQLEAKETLSAEDFIKMQYDSGDRFAEEAAPILLEVLAPEMQPQDLVKALHDWDFQHHLENRQNAFFYAWWDGLKTKLFKEALKKSDMNDEYYQPPDSSMLRLLKSVLGNNASPSDLYWFGVSQQVKDHHVKDRQIETKIESTIEGKIESTRQDAKRQLVKWINETFNETAQSFQKLYGNFGPSWAWRKVRKTKLPHTARISGFGRELDMPGAKYSPNANRGDHGPVWKMVVELGNTPKAWTMVAGGIDGNPFSPSYDRFLSAWSEGQLKPAFYFNRPEDIRSEDVTSRWILSPGDSP